MMNKQEEFEALLEQIAHLNPGDTPTSEELELLRRMEQVTEFLRFRTTPNARDADVTGQCIGCHEYGAVEWWTPNVAQNGKDDVRCPSCGFVGEPLGIIEKYGASNLDAD